MTDLALALLDTLDESALALLAERLAPYLERAQGPGQARSDSEWVDSRGAAKHLSMSVNALYKLTAARAIPFEQDGPGCKLYFKRSDLDAWRRAGGSHPHMPWAE
jgi:hypothetical protein